jgi:hypothetical protein
MDNIWRIILQVVEQVEKSLQKFLFLNWLKTSTTLVVELYTASSSGIIQRNELNIKTAYMNNYISEEKIIEDSDKCSVDASMRQEGKLKNSIFDLPGAYLLC